MSSKVNTYFGPSVIVFAAVWGLAFLILQALGGVLGGATVSADMSAEAVAERIKPVGQLNTGAPIVAEAPQAAASPEAAPAAARSGQEIYQSTCFACHGTGAAGAPKMGDNAAWADRIAKGIDALNENAIKGFTGKTGVMPPRGTCGNCSDDDLKAAVEYIVENTQ